MSSEIYKPFKIGSLRESQYARYYQVDDGNYHQYSQPGWLVSGSGNPHPDDNTEDDIDQRDKKQDSPPARHASDFTHQVEIGDWYPGQPGIPGARFIGNDIKGKRQPDIYC